MSSQSDNVVTFVWPSGLHIHQYYKGVTLYPQVLKSSPKRDYEEVTTFHHG
jgi:hypothetical protein